MKRISIVFGTRPEAIKLCPLILALRGTRDLEPHVCVTAQHRELLDQVLEAFEVRPDVDLGLMRPQQTLAELTARAVTSLDAYFESERPDLVLVQGDTTTVLCSALAAFYRGVPIGHVEAGLRTGDRRAPFPEEANRVLTSHLADYHFAPTERSRQNLLDEHVPDGRIWVTGNTVIDALLLAVERTRRAAPPLDGLPASLLSERETPLVLITGHRRESFGEGFESICRAIAHLAERFPDTAFVYPVHLNPNVREPVFRILGGRANVHLVPPASYLPFVALMDRSTLILTDSGGIQEEAPSLGKPVLVMRDVTERPEAVEAGTSLLVGTRTERIIEQVSRLLTEPDARAAMARKSNPYGDGRSCARIVEIVREILG